MFYIQQDEKIVLFDENLERLQNTIAIMPQYQGLEILETDREIIELNDEFVFEDEAQEQLQEVAKKERNSELDNKIQELQIMAIPEILNGNLENIKIYNDVIAGLENARP